MTKLQVGAKLLPFVVLAIILCFALSTDAQVKAQAQEVPTPPNLVVSDITTTGATVAVEATSGCDIESIIIEYRQDASDPYINIASGVCSDLIGTEYDLTGLTANTAYFLRASATLEYSIIVDDVVTTFTTEPIAQICYRQYLARLSDHHNSHYQFHNIYSGSLFVL